MPTRFQPVRGLLTPTLLILLLAAEPAHGQERPAYGRWSLTAGWVHHSQADALASPLRYSGWGVGGRLSYTRVSPRARTGVAIDFGAPSLASSVAGGDAFRERTHRLTVSVPHWRRVLGGARLGAFIGGRATADAYHREHLYAGGSEHYGDLFLLLEGTALAEFRPNRRLRLEERLAFPVAGVTWRGPYTGLKYAPSPRFDPPNRLQGLRQELLLSAALNERFALTLGHELVLLRHADPWELAIAAHSLRVGLELVRGAGGSGGGEKAVTARGGAQ